MRERPKQASYLQRHKKIEDEVNNSEASIIPKRIDRGGAPVSRVRAGVASKPLKSSAPITSGNGGKMIQYKNIDDIPDGLPDSPQLKRSNNSPPSRIDINEDSDQYEEEEDDEDYPINQNTNYDQSSSNYKPPSFPSEHGYNDSRYESSEKEARSNNYPPLQSSNNIKQQPLVYHKTHNRTPPKPFLSE